MARGSTRNVMGGARDGMKAPPPPGQHPVKAATATATATAMGDMAQGKSRQAMTPEAGAKVLQQSKKMPFGPPAVMACGLAVVASIAYFNINTTNKMEETAAMNEAGKRNPCI